MPAGEGLVLTVNVGSSSLKLSVLDGDERCCGDRAAGRVRVPLLSGAKRRGASSGRDHRALQLDCLGRQRYLSQPLRGLLLVVGDVDSKRAADRGGVVRIVAVRAQPSAVSALDQPRQRRKAGPGVPAIDQHVSLRLEAERHMLR